MKKDIRPMTLTITFSSCTEQQSEAIFGCMVRLCGAAADITDAPVKIVSVPLDRPAHVVHAATSVIHPHEPAYARGPEQIEQVPDTVRDPVAMVNSRAVGGVS